MPSVGKMFIGVTSSLLVLLAYQWGNSNGLFDMKFQVVEMAIAAENP